MINFIPEFVQGLVPGHAPGMAGKPAAQEGSEDAAEGFAEFLDAVLYAGSAVAAVAVTTAAPEDIVEGETLLSMTEGEDDAGLTTEAAEGEVVVAGEEELVEGAETEASESTAVADEESSVPASPRPSWAWGATRAQGAQEGQRGPVSGAPGADAIDGPEAAPRPEVPGSRAGELGAKAEGFAAPAGEGNLGRSGQAVGSQGEGDVERIVAEGSRRAAAPAAEAARPVAPPSQAPGGPAAPGTGPVAEPAAPAQAAPAQSAPAQSAAAQRILQIVDALAQAPPPRTMTVDMGGQDGVRLTVALRGDAVHVTVRADGGGDPSAWAWVRDLGRDLGTALGHRGLEFGGFSTGADDDGGDRRERAEAAREERELAQARGKSQGRGPAPAASDQAVRL